MEPESEQVEPGEEAVETACTPLRLGTMCTIREAEELKGRLLAHLDAKGPLFIDGSEVERADSAGVQLLVAFSLDCMDRGLAYGWINLSQALSRAITQLGVRPLLDSPGAVSPPPGMAPAKA